MAHSTDTSHHIWVSGQHVWPDEITYTLHTTCGVRTVPGTIVTTAWAYVNCDDCLAKMPGLRPEARRSTAELP